MDLFIDNKSLQAIKTKPYSKNGSYFCTYSIQNQIKLSKNVQDLFQNKYNTGIYSWNIIL